MIRYFSNTTPANYLALLLVFIGTQLYGWMHPAIVTAPSIRQGWVAHTVFQWLYSLPIAPLWWQIAGSILLLALALYVNHTFLLFRFTGSQHLYPALLLLTLGGIDPAFSILSPTLLATFFVMVALRTLLRLYQENTPRIWLWDTGFWFMLAILLYPSLLLAAPWLVITIAILRPSRGGELLALLMGLLTPVFLLGTYLYATDRLVELIPAWRSIAIPTQWRWHISLPTTVLLGALTAVVTAALLVTASRLNTYGIQVRQYIRVVGLLIPFLAAAAFYQGSPSLGWFFPLLLPFAILIGFQYAEFRPQKIASWVHLLLLTLVLLQQYVTFATA